MKIPQLIRALDGRFDTDHAVLLRQLLDHIDWLDAEVWQLDERIAEVTAGHADVLQRLRTIPDAVAELGHERARPAAAPE